MPTKNEIKRRNKKLQKDNTIHEAKKLKTDSEINKDIKHLDQTGNLVKIIKNAE